MYIARRNLCFIGYDCKYSFFFKYKQTIAPGRYMGKTTKLFFYEFETDVLTKLKNFIHLICYYRIAIK